jgi:hypothetical protein
MVLWHRLCWLLLTFCREYLQAEIETTARGADVASRRGLLGTQHVRTWCPWHGLCFAAVDCVVWQGVGVRG